MVFCCSLVVMASLLRYISSLTDQPCSSTHHRAFVSCRGIRQSALQPLWGCSSCGAWRWGSVHYHQPTIQHHSDHSLQASRQSICGPPWQSLHHHLSMPARPRQRSASLAVPASRSFLTAKKAKHVVRTRIS